jgi:hypothetical protein
MAAEVVSPFVKRVLIGGWSSALLGGVYFGMKQKLDFQKNHPYVVDALELAQPALRSLLGEKDSLLAVCSDWKSRGKTFRDHGVARIALTTPEGPLTLHVSAKRIDQQTRVPVQHGQGDEYDEYVIEGTGWKHYWDNPWDIKIAAIKKWRAAKAKMTDIIRPGLAATDSENNSKWEVTGLVVEDFEGMLKPVVGEVASIPLLERRAADFAAKEGYSRNRFIVFLSACVLAGVGVWLRRTRVTRKSESLPEMAFVRKFLLGHPLVSKIFKETNAVKLTEVAGGSLTRRIIDKTFRLESASVGSAEARLQAVRVDKRWKVTESYLLFGSKRLSLV